MCAECPANHFSAAGAAECADCESGKVSAPGSATCGNCPGGKYSQSPGAPCVDCPGAHRTSPDGLNCTCAASFVPDTRGTSAPSCTCAPGHYADNGTCEACPAGRAKPGLGDAECAACGQHAVAQNGTACECAATFLRRASDGACVCAPGTEIVGGVCAACTGGKVSRGGSNAVCLACPGSQTHSTDGVNCVCLDTSLKLSPTNSCACEPGYGHESASGSGGGRACEACAVTDRYSNTFDLAPCSSCPAHAHGFDGGRTCECNFGTFLNLRLGTPVDIVAGPHVERCLACPENAECHANRIHAERGFYLVADKGADVQAFTVRCQAEAACVDGGCAKGYSGFVCSSCDGSLTHTPSGECRDCETAESYGVLVLVVVAFVGVAAYLYVGAGSTESGAGAIQLLLSYLQLVAQVRIGDSLTLLGLFELNPRGVSRGRCVGPLSFAATWWLTVLLPLFAVAAAAVVAVCRSVRRRRTAAGEQPADDESRVRRWLLLLLLFSYIATTKAAASALSCVEVPGRLVLADDYSTECWSSSTHATRVAAASVVLAVYSVGLPVLVAARFFLRAGAGALAFIDADFLARRFREPRSWWEVVEVARRLLVTVLVVLLETRKPTLATVVVLTLGLFAVWHTGSRPYADDRLNSYADRMNLCLCVSFVMDLFASSASAAGRMTALVVVLLLNGAVTVAFVRGVVLPELLGKFRRIVNKVRGVELEEPLITEGEE